MRTFNSLASNCVIGPTPDTPAVRFCQKSSTVKPIGLTSPSPVTTTRWLIKAASGDVLAENHARVMPAESKAIRHRHVDPSAAGDIRSVIQIALRVRGLIVD